MHSYGTLNYYTKMGRDCGICVRGCYIRERGVGGEWGEGRRVETRVYVWIYYNTKISPYTNANKKILGPAQEFEKHSLQIAGFGASQDSVQGPYRIPRRIHC